MNKKQVKNMLAWTLSFTKKVVTLVTVAWIIQMIYSAILIFYAVKTQGDFSFLDTFISDNGESFRLIVGVNIISKTIENVFKYNEGGIFGQKVSVATNEDDSDVVG